MRTVPSLCSSQNDDTAPLSVLSTVPIVMPSEVAPAGRTRTAVTVLVGAVPADAVVGSGAAAATTVAAWTSTAGSRPCPAEASSTTSSPTVTARVEPTAASGRESVGTRTASPSAGSIQLSGSAPA